MNHLLAESVAHARANAWDKAIDAAERAADGHSAPAYSQLAAIHYEMGNYSLMEAATDAGLLRDPNHPRLRQCRGLLRLGRGDQRGWWDLRHRPWHQQLAAKCPKPEWAGEEMPGKSIVVIGQEGFGDQIMYARFFPWLEKRFGKVWVRPADELVELFKNSFPSIEIITDEHQLRGASPDTWVGTGSLAEFLPNYADQIYIKTPKSEVDFFGQHFGERSGKPRVALTWAGTSKHTQDTNRSMGFADFTPLFDVPGIDFYGFQFGPAAEQNHKSSWYFQIPDISQHCEDFADTAAALQHVDLVISVDTSIVHLAAAMGKPVWVMVKTPIDWRWGIPEERNDWYRTVRQFRNRPITDVAEALRQWAA